MVKSVRARQILVLATLPWLLALLTLPVPPPIGANAGSQDDQDEPCGYWNWYVYACSYQLLLGREQPPANWPILGVYRTEGEARAATCARMSNFWESQVGQSYADIDGKTYQVVVFADGSGNCFPPHEDSDGDRVPDWDGLRSDQCADTPPGTLVDRAGCPCDKKQDCKGYCQEQFSKRGAPGKVLLADSSSGEPPNCECWCTDEDGDLSTECFTRDCDQVCREQHGPEAKWDGEDAEHCTQCICQDGWDMRGKKCVPCEKICTEKDDRAQHDQANSREEFCACTCDERKGLEYDAETQKCGCVSHAHPEGDVCVCDANWQPRPEGGCEECPRHSHSSGTKNEPCEPNVGFRWKDDTKRECVPEPVFVGVKELKDYLDKEKGYTRHEVTAGSYDPKSYPAGTVTFWARQGVTKDDGRQVDGPDAHCSMTINEEGEQIEMGADRAQVFGAKASPQPLLPDTLQSATYVPQEIWLPPGGARLRPRLRGELEGMSRGRKPKTSPTSTGGSDWNCHGFLRAAAEHYAVAPDRGAGLPAQITDKNARYLPLKDPPGIPFAVELEAGALHGRGLEFDVFLPDGFVDFTNEFLVEVGEDGSTQVYVFAGEANYYPGEAGPTVRVLPGQMVAVRGGRASAPAPFDAASLEPWWPEGSLTARSGLGISLGSVLASGSCLVALAAASVLVWRAAGRRRAAHAASPPSRPAPARTPREGAEPGQPPRAPASAWGMLEVTQGLAPPRAQRLDKAVFTIGRSSDSDLVLRDSLISRRHVQIRRSGGTATVHDLSSTNGTFLNGRRVVEPCALRPGDVISLGQTKVTFAPGSRQPQRTATEQRPPRPREQGSRFSLVLDRPSLLIGRGSSCDLILVDSGVSRRHARVHYEDGLATVQDLDSSNGTFVNGKRITRPCPLAPGDVIHLGRTELVYRRGTVQEEAFQSE